jgi:restriction system protein
MTNYNSIQIYSIAIILFFFIPFFYKIFKFFKRFYHRSLLSRNRTIKKLKRLSWDDFERLSMELFAKAGWIVSGNEKKGADGGVDIWMHKKSFGYKNLSAIVQCKRYENAPVTIKVVREMYGLMHEYEVDEVYIVTTSRFTKECYTFIKDKKIKLIDGKTLINLIDKYS